MQQGLEFSKSALEGIGFCGWISFANLRSNKQCPRMPGVYVVSHPVEPAPAFAETSCGGWFKGRNPSVNIEVLSANWVADAEIIYIGKANQLRRRLIQYADFGEGKPVGHWGGRLIWQLPNVAELKVAWLETPDRDPLERKAELISLFRMRHGKPPFANDPHRLGK